MESILTYFSFSCTLTSTTRFDKNSGIIIFNIKSPSGYINIDNRSIKSNLFDIQNPLIIPLLSGTIVLEAGTTCFIFTGCKIIEHLEPHKIYVDPSKQYTFSHLRYEYGLLGIKE